MAERALHMVRQVVPGDDLAAICRQMTPEGWGKDNEMTRYEPARLAAFLANTQNLLLLAYDDDKIIGSALCYEMPHPAKDNSSLYVHELDTHPDYRRQGVSTALMQEAMRTAKDRRLAEVWVGTELTNKTADSFYRKLQPHEIEPSNIYAYKVH